MAGGQEGYAVFEGGDMEPIPETVKAIEELGPFANEPDLLDELRRMGDEVTDLVPDCVGLSLASAEHGVTFTLIARTGGSRFLNAIQDLAGTMDEGRGRAGAGRMRPRRTCSTRTRGTCWRWRRPRAASSAR